MISGFRSLVSGLYAGGLQSPLYVRSAVSCLRSIYGLRSLSSGLYTVPGLHSSVYTVSNLRLIYDLRLPISGLRSICLRSPVSALCTVCGLRSIYGIQSTVSGLQAPVNIRSPASGCLLKSRRIAPFMCKA
jgi:hypothetical protein